MKKITIHISGPMTGIKEYNYPLFNAVEEYLREEGFEVLNPASLLPAPPEDRSLYPYEYKALLQENIQWIFEKAEAQVSLYGSESSNGARAEQAVARALKLPWIYKHFIIEHGQLTCFEYGEMEKFDSFLKGLK